MARTSKKKEIDCEDNNASTGRKTRKKEPQKRLSRQVNETRVRRLSSSCGHQNSLNQAIISHYFRPLEVDIKKMQITGFAGTSHMDNSDLSSKRKIALRKYKPKKSKAKQLEEIQKYNKKIPMFFNYINPEKVKEIESKNNHEKTQTKSTCSSKKNDNEFLRNQRQLTEFYSLIEQISELSLSNKSETSQNNDNNTLIRKIDSNFEDDEIFEGGSRCLNTVKENIEGNREILKISKQKKIINRKRNSIKFDDNMDCDSSLITSRFNLSYHLSNFSIEPNDSFITISPKVASNTSHFDLEVGNTPTKTQTISTDAESLLDTLQDSSPQPNISLNLNKESLCSNEQVEEHRYVEESQVKNSSLNILSCHVDGPHCNNAANENEYLNNLHHYEMSLTEEGNKNITNEICKDKMIIEGEMSDSEKEDKRDDSADNVGDNNCEIVGENLHIKVHLKNKIQVDNSYCYSWEDKVIDFHKEELFENEDHAMREVNMNKTTSSMTQLENENQMKQKIHVNELLEENILQEINLNKDTNCATDDENLMDFHCCSQSENKYRFHQIYDLLDKENYNQDSISTFKSLDDPIPKELNGVSNQEQANTRQDRLPQTNYIHSSARFSKDEVSPAPSPPSLLSQTTLAMIPQSAWDTFPSFNVSTLDSEELNDDL